MSAKCRASGAGAGQYPFSPSQYFRLAGARAHLALRAAADSEMEVSAYFTSVHIPSFGRAVTGNAADSEMEGSTYFTSVHIPSFGRAGTGTAADSEMEVSAYFTSVHIPSFRRAVTDKREVVTPAKRKYITLLDLQGAHTAFWQHCYTQDINEWDTQTVERTERTEVKQHVPTSVYIL